MAIRVYDWRTDRTNLMVHPAIRGRFRRVEPGPAPRMHSHDIAGEVFMVMTGRCEFLVEDEAVTCGAGQLIYVEPGQRHALHAVGDEECVIYLSVVPHVEPTHTLYDDAGARQPPQYGAWRAAGGDTPSAATTAALAADYARAAATLATLAQRNAEVAAERQAALAAAAGASEQEAAKSEIDALWLTLRDLLQQVTALEQVWNDLAPRAMPESPAVNG